MPCQRNFLKQMIFNSSSIKFTLSCELLLFLTSMILLQCFDIITNGFFIVSCKVQRSINRRISTITILMIIRDFLRTQLPERHTINHKDIFLWMGVIEQLDWRCYREEFNQWLHSKGEIILNFSIIGMVKWYFSGFEIRNNVWNVFLQIELFSSYDFSVKSFSLLCDR